MVLHLLLEVHVHLALFLAHSEHVLDVTELPLGNLFEPSFQKLNLLAYILTFTVLLNLELQYRHLRFQFVKFGIKLDFLIHNDVTNLLGQVLDSAFEFENSAGMLSSLSMNLVHLYLDADVGVSSGGWRVEEGWAKSE